MRLGLLDPSTSTPYAQLGAESVDSAAHRALALTAARESIVLLKNARGLLPLRAGARIAFLGPHANSTQALLSNYHGDNVLVNSHSPLAVALARGLGVTYARGCNICDVVPGGFPNMPCTKADDTSGIAAAAAAAAAADVAVLFVGSDQTTEAENFDRNGLGLAGVQEQLVEAVLAAQPATVVVFISGGIVSSPTAMAGAGAALQAHYGGELGGDAIVDALTGAFSPAGKLPLTMYYNNITARDIRDVDLASAGGITHAWFDGPVLLPFGWGLSFTSFSYRALFAPAARGEHGSGGLLPPGPVAATAAGGGGTWRISRSAFPDLAAARATVVASVTNEGGGAGMASDCVVLVFVVREGGSSGEAFPRQALAAFARLRLVSPRETREHRFELDAARAFGAFRGADGAVAPPRGRYALRVGDVEAPALLSVEVVA